MKTYSTTPPNPTRPAEAAVNDVLSNLIEAFYFNRDVTFGLMIETSNDLYFLTHNNKCIRRVYALVNGQFETTDTRNLTDKDYDRILSKIEDTIGMSIDELSHGRISYLH